MNLPTMNTGESYAGLSRDPKTGEWHHLVLLPATTNKDLTWQEAVEWAKSVGGELPTRFEAALLYANLRDKLDTDHWHWTGTQHAAEPAWAWTQYFYYGSQDYGPKVDHGRARAVRRVPFVEGNERERTARRLPRRLSEGGSMTTPTPEDGCKAEEVSADQMEIRRLRHEVEGLTSAGVVECMARNPAVFERISELERELATAKEWREAVLNELIVAHIYTKEHDTNPRKAVQDAIIWNCQVALDPLVSPDARALIAQAEAERDALRRDAERWRFFASSKQTALMLGSNIDPFNEESTEEKIMAECNQLADAAIDAAMKEPK